MPIHERLKPAAIAGIMGLLVSSIGCDGSNEYVAPPPPTVTVSQPVVKPVTHYLRMTGRTEPVQEVEIRARVKGFLEKIHFEEGFFVEKGASLYRIDPAEYEAAVASAQASVDQAKASLEIAATTLDRMEEAVKTNAVSVLDVLESKAKRDGAKAGLAAANAALLTANLDLGYTDIKAPIAGRVGDSLVDVGNLVGASESTLLTTIVQYDPMYANFDMSERDILALLGSTKEERRARKDETPEETIQRVRQTPLELGLSTEEGFPHKGNIHYYDQRVDTATGTFLLQGTFPNPPPIVLIPGLFVRVRTPIGEDPQAILISERALGSDQGGAYLLVVDDQNVVQQRRVVLGEVVDGMQVIKSGLEPSEWVVVNGILRARPGAKVTPQKQDSAAASAAKTGG